MIKAMVLEDTAKVYVEEDKKLTVLTEVHRGDVLYVSSLEDLKTKTFKLLEKKADFREAMLHDLQQGYIPLATQLHIIPKANIFKEKCKAYKEPSKNSQVVYYHRGDIVYLMTEIEAEGNNWIEIVNDSGEKGYLIKLADRAGSPYIDADERPELEMVEPFKVQLVQIKSPNGETRICESYHQIKNDIIKGNLGRHHLVRAVGMKKDKEPNWSKLVEFVNTVPMLQALYSPLYSYMKKFARYGIIACIILKAIEVGITMFTAIPGWAIGAVVLVLIIVAVKGGGWAGVGFTALILGVMFGKDTGVNLLNLLVGVVIFSVFFGAPAGMIVGTIVGHFKKRTLLKAPDASEEGTSAYVIGLALPLVFLIVLVAVYLYWISPQVAKLG